MNAELQYVPAEEDDAAWWEDVGSRRDSNPEPLTEAIASAHSAVELRGPRPKRSTRIDLTIYLESLSLEEAVRWMFTGRPD